ncbi:MAG: hypothetical protein AB7R67_19015 [Vicinamibacterales bacterium]
MSDDPQLLIVGRRGRPCRAGEPATKQVHFLVTSSELAALKQVAAEQRQPLGAVVRDAVNTFVEDYGERRVFRAGPFE